MIDAVTFPVRKAAGNKTALVFVHGFSGEAHTTFGMLPAFLAGNPQLYDWDIHCFGYPTRLAPDITGVWSSNPNLTELSVYFGQVLDETFGEYEHLAIVAHSMGGLILQRALLDGRATSRVSHAICMGTPSGGLRKARLLRLFKQQVRDMDPESDFLKKLRRDWTVKFTRPPFKLAVVAGLSDQFVPPISSHEPFDESFRVFVPGNHLEMVKPLSSDSPTVFCVVQQLLGTSHSGVDSTSVPTKAQESIVKQALALELLGREAESIALLQQHVHDGTDIQGTLGGRYKRQWLRDPDQHWDDGAKAELLYADAYTQARRDGNHEQAYYNGINLAFMQLARHEDGAQSESTCQQVLEHTRQANVGPWQRATQAEAWLHLHESGKAIALYREAMTGLDPRERSSMFQQAIWTSRLLGDAFTETQLEALMIVGTN